MTQDQVFVPKTRSQLGLPPLDPEQEDLRGSSVTEEIKQELLEALGDSPMGATIGILTYLVRPYLTLVGLSAHKHCCSWEASRPMFSPTRQVRRDTPRTLTVSSSHCPSFSRSLWPLRFQPQRRHVRSSPPQPDLDLRPWHCHLVGCRVLGQLYLWFPRRLPCLPRAVPLVGLLVYALPVDKLTELL